MGTCDQDKRDFDFANVLECFRKPREDVDRAFVHTAYKWYKSAPDQPGHPLGNPKHIAKQLHDQTAAKFCSIKPTERLTTKLDPQGSRTCQDLDIGGKVTRSFCREEHRLNPRKGRADAAIKCVRKSDSERLFGERRRINTVNPIRTNATVAVTTFVNGVCDQNSSAAGCKAVAVPAELADENALGQANYDKLKKSAHCRGGVCQPNNYMPNATPACPSSIEICGKNFPTGATTNAQLIRHCVGRTRRHVGRGIG